MINRNIKIDLHIHTKSSEKRDGGIVENSTKENMDKLIDKLKENKIDLISFTDHNTFSYDYFREFKEKGKIHGIDIIPGTELNVCFKDGGNPGQVNVYFDAKNEEDYQKIESVLNEKVLSKISKEGHLNLREFLKVIEEIDLSILIIAPQSHNMDNKNSDGTSMSGGDSVSEHFHGENNRIFSFIDAIEFKNYKVEGILKKDMNKYSVGNASLITGSDCHDWNFYPFHDKKEFDKNNGVDKIFSDLKSLPTFEGLLFALSSPKTRINRTLNTNQNYVKSIKINDENIDLDKSVNVIIGNNGSGKTTIFNLMTNQKLEKWNAKIKKSNNINIVSDLDNFRKTIVKQNEYINSDNSLDALFSDYHNWLEIDDSNFKNSIETLFNKMIINFQLKIDFETSKELLKVSLVEIHSFDNASVNKRHINIKNFSSSKRDRFTVIDGEYTKIINMLDSAIGSFNTLLGSQYFVNKKYIEGVLKKLKEFKVSHEKFKIQNSNSQQKVLSIEQLIKDEKNSIKKQLTSDQRKEEDYISSKDKFLEKFDLYFERLKSLRSCEIIDYQKENINIQDGTKAYSDINYSYIKKTLYLMEQHDSENLINALFIKEYQNSEKIVSIRSLEELAKAINGFNPNNNDNYRFDELKSKLIELKNKYIIAATKTKRWIKEIEIEDIEERADGATPGQVALAAILKKIDDSNNGGEPFFVDQPEDNISNKNINDKIIKKINEQRDNRQFLIVTHNPLFVVNLDCDNLIWLEKHDEKIEIKSGPLESNDPNMLNIVIDEMEGGKELLERRLKVYGKWNR